MSTAWRSTPLLVLMVAGCGNAAAPSEKLSSLETPTTLRNGYGDLELGASFDETIAKVGTTYFSPDNLGECLMDMPLKGCILIWNNWVVPFIRKKAVPYRLHLTFDRKDRLTNISLVFSRRNDDITRAQCLEMNNRTSEWLTSEYGEFETWPSALTEPPDFMIVSMKDVRVSHSKNSLKVSKISSFLRGHCDVHVGFMNSGASDKAGR